MLDHVLGRPSTKSRRLQVLAVLAFWTAYLIRGNKHGPPGVRFWSRLTTKSLTTWQTVAISMIYLYAARNFSTLVGLASPEPMSNMYDATYFRATWVLTALDAGFWTAMKLKTRWLRDLASIVFSLFYLVAAERADEKVRKVRGMLTVEHLRVSWNKGNASPYLRFFQNLLRPRLTRWPPRQVRIPRPPGSDYKDPVMAWLYYDGPLSDLQRHDRLILDIPGGGFVAMDPRCNDDKLFMWAARSGLPILSLDYKKAPEFPYPYALNECVDVYASLVRTRGRCIGMSGQKVPRVILTGDSAGGNLATAATLMIIERNLAVASGGVQQKGAAPPTAASNPEDLPIPDGLVLFYPALDMNIGNWMSDEQMSLIKDRRTRGTNSAIIRKKSMQYNELAGTPHHSDDEDDVAPLAPHRVATEPVTGHEMALAAEQQADQGLPRSPHPEYSHGGPPVLTPSQPVSPMAQRGGVVPDSGKTVPNGNGSANQPEPLRTRLAMSSMISYFNDRVLTPELMRAMIILYIGPHNRPDFSREYLLSPVLAPDELLALFPKTYFLTGERDPLVDDTVIFAGRLRRVKEAVFNRRAAEEGRHDEVFDGRDVAEVALIPGISHGFLQFPTVYPPAWRHFERVAGWFDDIFAHVEVIRERQRRRAAAAAAASGRGRRKATGPSGGASHGVMTNGTEEEETTDRNGRARHHVRNESSGDEDRPLEMTRIQRGGKTSAQQADARKQQQAVRMDLSGTVGEEEEYYGDEAPGAKSRNKRNGRGRLDKGRAKSLVKLKSSDDLMGRRMQGLAGGLTGMGEED